MEQYSLSNSNIDRVCEKLEQITEIVQTIMGGLSSLLPALIFVLFTEMIVNKNLEGKKGKIRRRQRIS